MSPRAALLLAGLLTFAAPALAQQSAEDPVVAEVDGQKIHMSDVEAAYQELPEQYRQLPMSALAKPLVERVIDDRLLQAEAERQGLASDPVVQRELERARGRVLRAALLQKLVDEASTDEKLRAAYEKMKSDPAFAKEQYCASHILVESEDEAKAVIAELEAGADFAELAKARSKGPTGPKGGDLGCFPKGTMVPEFEAALTALEPGSYTKEPVQSRFGWHVVLLREKTAEVPGFEEAEPQVREQVARDAIRAHLAERRAAATIVRHEEVLGGTDPAGSAAPGGASGN